MGEIEQTARPPVERRLTLPIGIVVERRELGSRWQKYGWRPVAVIAGAPVADGWRELRRGEGFVQWHAATLPLVLHRRETEAYRYNLSGPWPAVFVGLRRQSQGEHEVAPFLVTASPFEAQNYIDIGEDIVEPVAMPPTLVKVVLDFIDRHHVEQPFYKRKRKREEGDGRDAHEAGGRGRRGG